MNDTSHPLATAAQAIAERISDHCERNTGAYAGVGFGTAFTFMSNLSSTIQLLGLLISLSTAVVNAVTQARRENRERRERKAPKPIPQLGSK